MCLANLSFVDCTYGQAYQAVMKLSNVIDSGPRHHMKAVTSTEKKTELCRGFAAGRCKFGENCKYLHKGPSPANATTPTPTPPTKPTPPAKANTKSKKNPPAYITTAHREFIGPPTGKPSEGNPNGYSRNQMEALNVLTRGNDAPPSSSTGYNDSWRDGSIMNALQNGQASGQKRGHMNMLRITTGDDAPPVLTPTVPPTTVPLANDESVQDVTTLPPTDTASEEIASPPSSTPMHPSTEASASSEVDDQDVSDPIPNLNTIATSPVRCYTNDNNPTTRIRANGTRLTPSTRYCLDRIISDQQHHLRRK